MGLNHKILCGHVDALKIIKLIPIDRNSGNPPPIALGCHHSRINPLIQ